MSHADKIRSALVRQRQPLTWREQAEAESALAALLSELDTITQSHAGQIRSVLASVSGADAE